MLFFCSCPFGVGLLREATTLLADDSALPALRVASLRRLDAHARQTCMHVGLVLRAADTAAVQSAPMVATEGEQPVWLIPGRALSDKPMGYAVGDGDMIVYVRLVNSVGICSFCPNRQDCAHAEAATASFNWSRLNVDGEIDEVGG